MSIKKNIKRGLVTAVGLPVCFVGTALFLEFKPEAKESVAVRHPLSSTWDKNKESFDILSWNLQFSASRKYHFFYDGGQAVVPTQKDVENTLQDIHNAIEEISPDILLLQEIDRHSSRTHGIDQLRWLIEQDNGWSWASTPYYKVAHVPHPSHQHLGKMDMHLSIMSRARLSSAERIGLPLLNEPRWRQMFNLKRAILHSKITIPGFSTPVSVGVTHLSAFSKGDGTLEKQIEVLLEWIQSHDPSQPWILAGDFNLLPPGDVPSRLGEDAKLYSSDINPILPLMKYQHAFPDALSESSRTYLSFGNDTPDRKIDYIFYGGPIELVDSKVHSQYSTISDHLPIWARFRFN